MLFHSLFTAVKLYLEIFNLIKWFTVPQTESFDNKAILQIYHRISNSINRDTPTTMWVWKESSLVLSCNKYGWCYIFSLLWGNQYSITYTWILRRWMLDQLVFEFNPTCVCWYCVANDDWTMISDQNQVHQITYHRSILTVFNVEVLVVCSCETISINEAFK